MKQNVSMPLCLLVILLFFALAGCGAPPAMLVMARGNTLVVGDGQREGQIIHTLDGGLPMNPAVSPDRQLIAFVGAFPPPPDSHMTVPVSKLYLMRSDGSALRVLWEPARGLIGRLAWAPDGRTIYAGVDGLRVAPLELGGYRLQEIVRIDAGTGAFSSLFEEAFDPALAPDGAQLAYLRVADTTTEERPPIAALEIRTIDGMRVLQLVDGAAFTSLASPRFSPDGQRIIFFASGGPPTAAALLPWLLALLEPPTAEAHGFTWDLWEVGVDGKSMRRLAELREDSPTAAFSPDGREIVVLAGGGLYSMRADGSELRKQAAQGDHGGIDWLGK